MDAIAVSTVSAVFVDYSKIGSEIRRRRKRIGLSQEKLGELVGLSQKQISRIENYGQFVEGEEHCGCVRDNG